MENTYFKQELIDEHLPQSKCIPAMLIWKLPSAKEHMLSEICENGEYFAEVKKDGYFYEYEKTEDYAYLLSRNPSKVTGVLTDKLDNVPHIRAALDNLPTGTIVCGEIYYPGKTSKDVTRVMGCKPAEAIKRQQGNLIHFYIHDLIYYDGENMMNKGALERYNKLKEIYDELNLSQHPFLELAEAHTENIFDLINSTLADGEEGVVLKRKNSIYAPEKRTAWETIKVKKTDGTDVVITGVCDPTKEYNGKERDTWKYWVIEKTTFGQGEEIWTEDYRTDQGYEANRSPNYRTVPVTKAYYYGWKTAIEIGYWAGGALHTIGTVSSGLTDELRAALGERPQDFIGKVAEIKCMEKDRKENTLRHPFFVKIREDKNQEECTLEEIFK